MATLFILLIALACPLMMILMMRGHGHDRHGTSTVEKLRRRHDD